MAINTEKVLKAGTARSKQSVLTQIRLLLKEQSDQSHHYLPFDLYLSDTLSHCLIIKSIFRTVTVFISGVSSFRNFTATTGAFLNLSNALIFTTISIVLYLITESSCFHQRTFLCSFYLEYVSNSFMTFCINLQGAFFKESASVLLYFLASVLVGINF